MTSGLQKSDLIIIAARPSMGKTAFAMNIAENAAILDQKVVAVFSLEMSNEALLQRLLCSTAVVDSHRFRTGSLWQDDMRKISEAVEKLTLAPIFIDDTPGISLSEMRAKTRRLKQKQGALDLVIVDYLQLMSGGSRRYENRTQEVSAISRGLKALAKEMEVPVIALSQLSRAPESRGSGDHRPQLADLRESGSIEQDADVVAFIFREEVYKPDEPELEGIAEILIRKQRNGPTGTVKLAFLKKSTRFETMFDGGGASPD
jgi:replicative DNA helicase